METLRDFLNEPWKEASLHPNYAASFLHLTPFPEVATGEILLASLYRNVGFSDSGLVSEKVWHLGKGFRKHLEKGRRPDNKQSEVGFDAKLWNKVVNRAIATPNLSGQSSQRGSQISPLVPDATLYSMSARLTGNPWNPGKLIAKMIAIGTGDYGKALEIWRKLFDKLSVTEEDDDTWAFLLQSEFETWRTESIKDAWKKPSKFPYSADTFFGPLPVQCPANRFVEDLQIVLELKGHLTRRQWISMLESLCRIGSSAHVTWLCHAHDVCRELLENAVFQRKSAGKVDVESILNSEKRFWSLGQLTTKPIRETARHYIEGRGALNLILHMLETRGVDMSRVRLRNPDEIMESLKYLANLEHKFDFNEYLEYFNEMIESDRRIAECKKGSSKNVLEFLGHVARQRMTSEAGLESYDQGYYVEKRGNYASAPWVLGLGPLSTILMVHCAASKVVGPCTVQDLCKQLAGYGIEAELALGAGESLGKRLRDMSIAIDSPDAEGGMVLVSPLAGARSAGR
ncbi:hypothetical protein [Marinobacter arenosus]|uniref:hypothetical protein n=1 Tax=Marinobacter arenosus TaxID=2856822 RepID=UPI001C4D8F30|nr:hypothetical protein [Marinobacter arenosus]MBW0147862.1 hypothetical protein [Marinobacter arenosus]